MRNFPGSWEYRCISGKGFTGRCIIPSCLSRRKAKKGEGGNPLAFPVLGTYFNHSVHNWLP
jgi:hypothetical protein